MRLVFVGVHREGDAPLRFLLDGPYRPSGLVTLTAEAAASVSGAVDLATIARAAGVPVLHVRNVNDRDSVAWIRGLEPDVLLVVGWTQLVRDELLRVPRIACLGFHASLLPRYRGRAPINWALINDEPLTGNTLIVLEAGADEGDIVAQRAIPISDEDDCATLYDKVAATEVDMLREVLPLIRDGRLPRRAQDASQATVMPRRRPEDGVIDWTWSTRRIFNWIRGLTHPYPGAFTSLAGRRLFVWRGVPAAFMRASAPPGSVARAPHGAPVVATGDGWLELVRVQMDGGDEVDGVDAAKTFLPDGALLA